MQNRCRVAGITILYRNHTSDEYVLEEMKRDIFFSGTPEYLPHPNDVIIDVGAHIGTFSILAGLRLAKGKVFAIEACKENFSILQQNVSINNLHNVIPYNLALSDRKGLSKLFHTPTGNWGYTITKDSSEEYELVATDTLANFMKDNNIRKCDFMKLNCEGSEFAIILNSTKETLQKIRILLILYHLDLVAEYKEQDMVNWLHECGFSTEVRNKTAKRGWIVARNKAFKTRKDELLQYSLWRVFSTIGGRRVGLFLRDFQNQMARRFHL